MSARRRAHPLAPPRGPWIMAQRWHDLLFLHWPLPAGPLAPHVPAGLTLDTREGQAWLGIAAFRMTGVRLRGLPPLPGVSAFPELNVRTYVTREGRPGVLFLSLDAGSALAVELARWWYRLPYFRARMTVTVAGRSVCYASRRTDPRGRPAAFRALYAPAGEPRPSAPGSLEHWLTERYCLYTADQRGRVYRADIQHAPWPLQPATATVEDNTMALAQGLVLPPAAPLLHFAARLEVRVWPLRPASAAGPGEPG